MIAGYYSSSIFAASVMLHKCLTVSIESLPWGPFRLERSVTPVTICALLYSIVVGVFSTWPPFSRPTPKVVDYCVLIWGATLLFSMEFCLVYGRKHYVGPVLEIPNQ